MSFLVFKKCCFCVDLRFACFLIGYLTLMGKVSSLVVNCISLANSDATLLHHHSILEEDHAFHKLTAIISIMILVFEVLLCIALLVGLCKRLDQHLEMFYVGSFAFLIMGIILYTVVLLRYGRQFGQLAWFLAAVKIVVTLIDIYFLSVIRSYYYKMKEEATDDREELGAKEAAKSYFARTKPVLFSPKP